jgi:hypothetical protein
MSAVRWAMSGFEKTKPILHKLLFRGLEMKKRPDPIEGGRFEVPGDTLLPAQRIG